MSGHDTGLRERTIERIAGFYFVLSKIRLTPYLRGLLLAESSDFFGQDMCDSASVLLGLQDLGATDSLAALDRVVARLGTLNEKQQEMIERLRNGFKGQ